MNNFFESIDRYKYGIIAALASYMLIFAYLQLDTYPMGSVEPYEPFYEGSYVETPEIQMKQENIEVPQDFKKQEFANMAKDVSDKRKTSYENYSANQSAEDVVNKVLADEKKYYSETGEAQKREKIRQEMDKRKNENITKDNTTNTNKTNPGGDTGYKGETMIKWELNGRSPYQNNEWHVRNPGYTNYRSGFVVINIKVDQNGKVISAVPNREKSSGATEDMIATAVSYAKKSRFNFSSSAPASQSGWISYTFQSQ